jgi:folate-binding Fe-S cluster repair protein YgfZ
MGPYRTAGSTTSEPLIRELQNLAAQHAVDEEAAAAKWADEVIDKAITMCRNVARQGRYGADFFTDPRGDAGTGKLRQAQADALAAALVCRGLRAKVQLFGSDRWVEVNWKVLK